MRIAEKTQNKALKVDDEEIKGKVQMETEDPFLQSGLEHLSVSAGVSSGPLKRRGHGDDEKKAKVSRQSQKVEVGQSMDIVQEEEEEKHVGDVEKEIKGEKGTWTGSYIKQFASNAEVFSL